MSRILVSFTWVVLLLFGYPSSSSAEGAGLKIVAFGTSLTSRGGWPAALQAELGSCLGRQVEVKTLAMAGSTTDWALQQVDRVTAARPDIILIEFYGNDSALNRWMGVSTSRANFATILDRLRAGAPDARVVMMAFNPVWGLRGWARPFFNSYVDAHREEIDKRSMDYIDLRPIWQALPPAELDHAIPDGLHPRPEASARILVPSLARFLAGGDCRDGNGRG